MSGRLAVMITEKQFQQQIVEVARLCGWKLYHSWLSVRSAAGFPDLVLVRAERLLFVELKSERGRFTEAQLDWLVALRQTDAEVYCWDPRDWEELVEVLR